MTVNADGFNLAEDLKSRAGEISHEIIAWRREFHQFPELAFEETVTSSRVVDALSVMDGMEVIRGFGSPTSVLGVLGKDTGLPAVVLRADMDALAIEEESGLAFSSCFPGVMHACGHDAHIASLLGAARLLSERASSLRRPVIFLFQPAEEGKAGAKKIVDAGFFDKFQVKCVLGLHFWPSIPFGQMATRKGCMTALSDRIHIMINGSTSHAASPHQGVDPTVIAAHILLSVQDIISREKDPQTSAVISFGRIEAGEAYNIIPGSAHMWGTLRAHEPEVRDFIQGRLEEMIPLIARAHRATASVEYNRNYPCVVNDPEITSLVLEKSRTFFSENVSTVTEMTGQLLAGEDFAFYSLKAPSCFMLMGTGGEFGLHNPRYDVPEELIPLASAWEAFLALSC
ncbi:MAG TPA: M20 family metallopeptidase [Synergistales bacterium]|jgi:amidohydrolase|nr:M20 family metallopeptidase [Synergistales bacterium]HRV71347.1 M20 family metallopeptidase [Thermovirgaceae bacterium]